MKSRAHGRRTRARLHIQYLRPRACQFVRASSRDKGNPIGIASWGSARGYRTGLLPSVAVDRLPPIDHQPQPPQLPADPAPAAAAVSPWSNHLAPFANLCRRRRSFAKHPATFAAAFEHSAQVAYPAVQHQIIPPESSSRAARGILARISQNAQKPRTL